MKCLIEYADEQRPSACHDTVQEAVVSLLEKYPKGVVTDGWGRYRNVDHPDQAYHVHDGCAATVWATAEERSYEVHYGCHAVAEIIVD